MAGAVRLSGDMNLARGRMIPQNDRTQLCLGWHQATRRITNTYGKIAIEELSLAFMTRNSPLSLSAHNTALGMFRQMLGYKVGNLE
jgi:transposase